MKSNDNFIVPRSAGKETFDILENLVSMGPRFPGSDGQIKAGRFIRSVLERNADSIFNQRFDVSLYGKEIKCTNIIGYFKASVDSKNNSKNPLLIGTHYDTRIRADREENIELKTKPIIGANDGGSGTAILLWMAGVMDQLELKRDVLLVFFDAEDIGDIDGNDFSVGASFFAENPVPLTPAEVIVLDMVGGKNMVLDIDAHVGANMESYNLTRKLWQIGIEKGFKPFLKSGKNNIKYIICDHIPFLIRDITSTILIDLNYPMWHTQSDTMDNVSEESLWIIEEVLISYLQYYS